MIGRPGRRAHRTPGGRSDQGNVARARGNSADPAPCSAAQAGDGRYRVGLQARCPRNLRACAGAPVGTAGMMRTQRRGAGSTRTQVLKPWCGVCMNAAGRARVGGGGGRGGALFRTTCTVGRPQIRRARPAFTSSSSCPLWKMSLSCSPTGTTSLVRARVGGPPAAGEGGEGGRGERGRRGRRFVRFTARRCRGIERALCADLSASLDRGRTAAWPRSVQAACPGARAHVPPCGDGPSPSAAVEPCVSTAGGHDQPDVFARVLWHQVPRSLPAAQHVRTRCAQRAGAASRWAHRHKVCVR